VPELPEPTSPIRSTIVSSDSREEARADNPDKLPNFAIDKPEKLFIKDTVQEIAASIRGIARQIEEVILRLPMVTGYFEV
jgi:hypothetical protein